MFKHANSALKFQIVLTVILMISLTGCILPPAGYNVGLTFKEYEGPKLPNDRIALIKLEHDKGDWILLGAKYCGIGINNIDGRKVHYKFGSTVALMPGDHDITFYYSAPLANHSSGRIAKHLNLEAGKKYKARTGYQQTYSQRNGNTYSWGGNWWVIIDEGNKN